MAHQGGGSFDKCFTLATNCRRLLRIEHLHLLVAAPSSGPRILNTVAYLS